MGLYGEEHGTCNHKIKVGPEFKKNQAEPCYRVLMIQRSHTDFWLGQLLIDSSCQCAFRGIFPLESAHHGY